MQNAAITSKASKGACTSSFFGAADARVAGSGCCCGGRQQASAQGCILGLTLGIPSSAGSWKTNTEF
jgi:hypothetical protein